MRATRPENQNPETPSIRDRVLRVIIGSLCVVLGGWPLLETWSAKPSAIAETYGAEIFPLAIFALGVLILIAPRSKH